MTSRKRADRIAKITCPRQAAVARSVGPILDVFSTGFAKMGPDERLAAFVPADDFAARWRNAVRMPALGMVARLGRDLGLGTNELHGDAKLRGRTQVPELAGINRTTLLNALWICDAMLEDQADMPSLALARYATIRSRAQAEVRSERSRNECECSACSKERAA